MGLVLLQTAQTDELNNILFDMVGLHVRQGKGYQ